MQLEKSGDRIRIDFTGSSPQTTGPANAAPAAMMAAALYFMRCLAPDAPNNAGCLAPLDLVLPPGSVVNPDYPAAVNARTATVKLACNAIISAWSRDRSATSAAANAGVATVIAFGGTTTDGQRYQLTEIVASGAGGSSLAPGASGLSTDVGNARNTPVEIIERETPIRVESYGFNPGSGGGGQHKGGDGLRRCYLLTEGAAQVSYRGERHDSQARGLQGGSSGATSCAQVIRQNGDTEQLTARTQIQWRAGERLLIETAGAGGWGAVDATPHNPAIRRTEC
ncbi:MAG: hydantoinase B/oxoprolinase family protein [Rhodospirillales bacterium]